MTKRATDRPPLTNIAIRASAGSGKTYALTLRYIELLFRGAAPSEILATTFTRKAAGEIMGRVLSRLAAGVLDSSKRQALLDELAEATTEDAFQRIFDQTLDSLPTFRVGTMDRYFAQRARELGLELDLPPGWSVLDEFDDDRLREQAIAEFFEIAGPRLVIELSRLLSKGDVPRSIRGQIEDLVAKLQGIYRDAQASAWEMLPKKATLNDAEFRAAVDEVRRVDVKEQKSILSAREADLERAENHDWDAFVGTGLAKKLIEGATVYNRVPIPEELIRAYQPLLAHADAVLRNRLVTRTEATRRLIAEYDLCYRKGQYQAAGIKFDDVTRALAEHALAAGDGDGASDRLKHLLLDEFQDTSPAQWNALLPLVARCATEGSFFSVGDPKQAIYGWRGGSSELFDVLDSAVANLERRSLRVSFRSSPIIIDLVNTIFGSLDRNEVMQSHPLLPDVAKAWSQRFESHETARSRRGGYVRMIVSADDEVRAYYRFVAAEVKRRHDERPRASIGVLVRKNDAVAAILFELRLLDLEASEEGGNPLGRSPAVALVLSFLELIDHPTNSVCLFHVSESPLGPRIGLASGTPVEDVAMVLAEWREELLRNGYARTLRRLISRFAPCLDLHEQDRLDQLVELAITFEVRDVPRPSDFVRFVEKRKVEDPSSARVRVMTIHQAKGLEFDIVVLPQLDVALTGQTPLVVQGRPTPAAPIDVVLRYCNEKEQALLPARFARLFTEYRQSVFMESLCILYVAITRAIHECHLIIAPAKLTEKKPPTTFAGILRAALAPGMPASAGALLYQAGTPHWKEEEEPTADETSTSAKLLLAAPSAWGRLKDSNRLAVAPSRQAESLGSFRSLLHVGDGIARARGDLWHAWLAEISWEEEGFPSDSLLWERAESAIVARLDVARELSEFKDKIQSPALRAIWQKPTAEIELWRERPFVRRVDQEIIRGIFDRVVIFRENGRRVSATILDYKTDDLRDRDAIPARARHYRPQLEAYRAALARMLRISEHQIAGQLVFLSLGEFWTLPTASD